MRKTQDRKINPRERVGVGGREILRYNSKGADLLYFHSDGRVAFGTRGGGSINTNKLAEIPCEAQIFFFFCKCQVQVVEAMGRL